jgi:hypothetical protein
VSRGPRLGAGVCSSEPLSLLLTPLTDVMPMRCDLPASVVTLYLLAKWVTD